MTEKREEIRCVEFNNRLDREGLRYHHTSLARGYVSRKSDGFIVDYNGRFGRGYKLYRPNFRSTRYCYVDYYTANAKN